MSAALPSTRRRLVTATIAGALLSGLGWVVGLDWPHAALIGICLVAAVGLRRVPSDSVDPSWAPRADERADHGVRRDVARLSWYLQGHESRVERTSVRRLRAIAVRRLGERGLDLDAAADEAACRSLLGARAHAVLTAEPHRRPPFDDFLAAVDAVENLSPHEASR